MATPVRRGHGEGSVYRDAANGTWVGAISLGRRPDGARIRRKVTGRTKTEVRDKLKRLQAETDAGLKTSASYTLSKAVDDWAAEALDGRADKTIRSHVDLLRPWAEVRGGWPPATPAGMSAVTAARSAWVRDASASTSHFPPCTCCPADRQRRAGRFSTCCLVMWSWMPSSIPATAVIGMATSLRPQRCPS
jgi:hypothetical protein